MKALTSGKLAKEAGVNLETIRFYERKSMLPRPPRAASGYRLFPRKAIQRIRFIRRAQQLGFTLKEIKELLTLGGTQRTGCAAVRVRAQRKIIEIERKIAALSAMKDALTEISAACGGNSRSLRCPMLESLCAEDNRNATG